MNTLDLAVINALGRGTGRANVYAIAAVLKLKPGREGADEVRAAANRIGLELDGAWVSLPTCEWR